MGNYITTYTRKHFDPINPDAELICIEDIAHALPMNLSGKWTCQLILVCGRALYFMCEGSSGKGIF